MPPAIPDRWIPYKACGRVIEDTRIICFKVPLRKIVQQKVPEIKTIWDIPAVLAAIPKLGAVIDLTNTTRYYNPKEFEEANVIHRKISMPGRVIPPEDKVREFINAVDEFLRKDCESLIGVHCTHGLNRTGYMVCRYMCDRLGYNGREAIKKFEKARGYQIERELYTARILGTKLPPPELGQNQSSDRSSTDIMNDIKSGDEDTANYKRGHKRKIDTNFVKNNKHINSDLSWRRRDEHEPNRYFTQNTNNKRVRRKSRNSTVSDPNRPYSYVYDY